MRFIDLRHLRKSFGHQLVLNDVSLKIEKGQSLVIIGASGSGKSVMLKNIVGLLKPDRGEVYFDGIRIDTLPEREHWCRCVGGLGFCFTRWAQLFDSLNVYDNIAAFSRSEAHCAKSDEEIKLLVAEKLRMVGLPEVSAKMPAELSGGQKKRVALARAIALNPEVVLYDEPTTGLDPIRSDVINELILKLKRELNITSIVVTHDMASAFKVADRIVMLYEGKLIIDGSPDEIRNSTHDVVRRFVLGEASDQELASLKMGV